MLNSINTKLLIAILAALGAVSALLMHEHEESQKAAADIGTAAAVLEQQMAEADEHNRQDQEFRKKVEVGKRKNNVGPGKEAKTWRSYVP